MSSNLLFNKNYFELFGLEVNFSQDLEKLRQRYLSLQSQFHPDKVAGSSNYERQFVLQAATLINDAYQLLKNPATRAKYLLELRKMVPISDATYAFDEDFLMEQMALREQLVQFKETKDSQAVCTLKAHIQSKLSYYETELSHAFQNMFLTEKINQLIGELQFYQKLEKELREI